MPVVDSQSKKQLVRQCLIKAERNDGPHERQQAEKGVSTLSVIVEKDLTPQHSESDSWQRKGGEAEQTKEAGKGWNRHSPQRRLRDMGYVTALS